MNIDTGWLRAGFVLLTTLLVWTGVAQAQRLGNGDGGRAQVTRAELEYMLAQVEGTSGSADVDEQELVRLRREAGLIRARLEEGDFQTGDRIELYVEGEGALTGEFTVSAGRVLRLPQVGDIPLAGVLRSELEEHLREQLSRFLRDPVVRARSYIRVTILGEVGNPGYYSVPTESLVTEALMQAGGPTRAANVTGIRIERDRQRIWQGRTMEQAVVEGRTLDQLSLRAGDRIILPKKRTLDARTLLHGAWIISSVVTLVTLIF